MFVYFIQNGSSGDIKIGYTTNIQSRLRALQTSSSASLRLLGYINGNRDLEKELHRKFFHYRIRDNGEWFTVCNDIIEYINLHNLKSVYLELNGDKVEMYFKLQK